jgi:hypothetical protein
MHNDSSQRAECASIRKINRCVLYRTRIVVYCDNYKKYRHALCVQNSELLVFKLAVHIVNTKTASGRQLVRLKVTLHAKLTSCIRSR